MTTLLGIFAALILGWFALKWFANASPSAILGKGPWLAIAAAAVVFAGLLLSGRAALAMTMLMVGIPVYRALTRGSLFGGGLFGGLGGARGTPKPGHRSMVRSAAFEMELDHDTGAISGKVLAGSFEGRALASLGAAELQRLYGEVAPDPESLALLETYLDRRLPRWREDFEMDPAARHGRPARAGPMSEEEAYQILGLAKGADEAEIRSAHRRLMKRVHPDQGGSTFLAARINEAKDRLLSKHR
ncbi:DnaJ domain-containing protein [Methylobrevis albus]|uniref:DnaJ domain-containing protein n=1 Tax=Methylobrevis albus TaxID=2793297 RepID=A0A931I4C9_9HYPH|nr:DnaJ domain-containing protein [Methylobrevis albus]MBH0240032.1 DnaJ domain-containing protein [Methylobrevis albus]